MGAGIDATKITTGSLALANGGTGATTSAAARTSLGVVIGTNVQAYDADLDDLADGSLTGSKVGTGISAANVTTGTLPTSVLPNGQSGVPIGTVIAFASSTVPVGWLECDATSVSRTTYSALFSVIGVTWGGGDGTTTFNLPDLRGNFLRGWDHGSTNDPDHGSRVAGFTLGASGNNVGSYQGDSFQGHFHLFGTNLGGQVVNGSYGVGTASTQLAFGNGSAQGNFQFGSTISDGTNGTPKVSSETRPRNAYVMYIIKYQ